MEQTVQRERKIRIIPATKPVSTSGRASGSKQRVAAYCRVSTDSEEQLTSYTAQKAYYTQKIGENPDWEMAGIFADKGITGTSMKKRTEFKRMIAACKRGRIDLILTKRMTAGLRIFPMSAAQHKGRTAAAFDRRMEDIANELAQTAGTITEFDEVTVRQLVSNIKVVSKDTLLICFKDGTEITQTI